MKKLFTLLIAFMLTASINSYANTYEEGGHTYLRYSATPDNGAEVLELSQIVFSFSKNTYCPTRFLEGTDGVFKKEGGKETYVSSISNNNNNSTEIVIQLTNPITTPGTYILKIQAKKFTEDNIGRGIGNNTINITYTVVAPPLVPGEAVTPAVGSTVTDLSTITIPFPEKTTASLGYGYISNGGEKKAAMVKMSDDGLNAIVTCDQKLEAGPATLEFHKGFFKGESGKLSEQISYTWNVVKASLTIENFHIYKGYTQEITIDLTNGIDFSGFQADLTLPAGLTVVDNKFTLNRGVEDNHVLQSNVLKSSGKTRLLCYPTKKVGGTMPNLTGNSGDALVTFTVQASADFTGGKIVVDGIVFSTANGDPYMLSEAEEAAVEAREYATEITFTNEPKEAFETGEATPQDRKFEAAVNAGAYNDEISWTVSPAEGVITFENGIITAVGVGQATITATALGADPDKPVTKSCTVKVVYTHATAITIQPTEVLFEVDDRQTLTAILDKETNKAGEIVWTSDKPAVAEIIITDGVVEVVGKAIGTAEITAQIKNGNDPVLEATIPVKVDATMATTLEVNPAQVKLETGGQTTLRAIVDDEATNPKISWYVEEGGEQYVSVNENGVVTALAVTPAAVKVYAKTGDGSNLTDFAEVTVVATLVENVTIALVDPNDDNQLMNTETVRLVANMTGTTNKNVLWTSSDEAMATVAVVEGVAVVTAGSKTGDVTIFATIEGTNIRGEYKLTIIPTPATEIAINYTGETKFEIGAAQVALTATVGPDLATDKTYAWTSSDEEIAAIDANGVVTFGEKPGVVTITAKANGAAEGQEVKATINFEVVYTLATAIAIDQEPFTFKANDRQQLTATTDAATNKAILWTSSDAKVATVNADGLVTAVGVGQATITATIEGTEITDTLVVTVEATDGDVNNDGEVDILDVTATAAYILGDEVDPFIFAAADLNLDSKVNVTDIVYLVNIILTQQDDENTPAAVAARMMANSDNSLYIEDFDINEGETKQIAVKLNNNMGFIAFQADFYLPEGLQLVESSLSARKSADHVLTSALRDSGAVRMLSYSLGLNEFAESEGDLIYLTVKADEGFIGDFQIEIDNIRFVDADQNKYHFASAVANVTGVNITGIENVEGDEFEVKVVGNSIVAPEGAEVYDLNGLRVDAENLANGIYIVKVGNQIVKVVI